MSNYNICKQNVLSNSVCCSIITTRLYVACMQLHVCSDQYMLFAIISQVLLRIESSDALTCVCACLYTLRCWLVQFYYGFHFSIQTLSIDNHVGMGDLTIALPSSSGSEQLLTHTYFCCSSYVFLIDHRNIMNLFANCMSLRELLCQLLHRSKFN